MYCGSLLASLALPLFTIQHVVTNSQVAEAGVVFLGVASFLILYALVIIQLKSGCLLFVSS